MRYTIKDVAARAGVSVGTVSRVVNGDPRVLDANRARVREAIEALGYRPNPVAQTLVAGGAPRRPAPPPVGAPRLAVVGTVSVDHFALLPAWPERGSRVSADRFERCIGGPAANVAIAAARLGGPYRLAVELVSSLGDDADSDWALGELIGCGVSVAPVLRRPGHRLARSIVLVERQGLRTIIGEPLTLPPTDVAVRLEAMLPGDLPLCLHLEGYRAGLFEALPEPLWRGLGLRSLDSTGLPSVWRHWPNFLRLCAAFDVIFLSRTTARGLLGLDIEDRLLAEMLAARLGRAEAPRARLVVTLGAGGSSMIDGEAVIHAPALPVPPVDTTGAGDVFVGLFLAVLLTGHPPADALRLAARGASLSVTALGVNTVPITAEALAAAAP